jgi:uncharacterized repeat protein (TIGR01451 family)/MYXO-CTERM domain-containing protein
MAGQAEASTAITATQARSSAVLALPAGAAVTHAYLYWAARVGNGIADPDVTFERTGVFSTNVTASGAQPPVVGGVFYQSVADVTALVQMHGAGSYTVSGVDSVELANLNQSALMAGWWMVVFYQDGSAEFRNLTLFDGLDSVALGSPVASILSGFTVPNSGFEAKLGVIAYEGDNDQTGDQIQWNGTALMDLLGGDIDNFFNSTRSSLGMAVSVVGDLPQLTGAAQSMSSMDLDIVDITTLVMPGQTMATVTAASTDDNYLLGGFVTSISTIAPDLSTSAKSAVDLNGGGLAPGDIIEYTIIVTNTGEDTATDVVLSDPLPPDVTFVPGSIEITQGPNMGAKTDASGDDQGEYNAGTETVTVRLGTDADAIQGGRLAIGESTTVRFQVTVNPDADGVISNQAVITASGQAGGLPQDYPTDGDGGDPGSQPTDVVVDTDNDGISDGDETTAGTDPNDADSDDDGLMDGAEPMWDVDTDGDGLINALDPDSDDDALFDGTELGLDCNGPGTDAGAEQCIPDGDNGATTTDPLDADTDDGGVSDGAEDADRDGTIDAGETDPTAGHGADDSTVMDSDGDGLSDGLEQTIGTDPNDADTDDDGAQDGQEPNPAVDTDGDGLIDALDVDSDNDGLYDGTEMGLGCNQAGTDAGAGHCIPDGDNGATTTSPLDPDTDDGGASDGSEDPDRDGVIDPGETDPTAGNGADDSSVTDSDGDGLGDALEIAIGSDPDDQDSDDDGLLDGQEPNPADDHDGDGTRNTLDEDSDDDGLFDGTEAGQGCANGDTDPASGTCIADADPTTVTGVLDPDTDDGGVIDGEEDANHDGAVDGGETDPNDPADDMLVECQEDSDCGGPMSGEVCHDETHTCVDGCRGMNGNGCPEGQLCTSMDETIGVCIPPGTGGGGGGGGGPTTGAGGGQQLDQVVVQGGGCACAVPSGGGESAAPWALLAAGAVAAARRRRRGR